MQIPPEISFRNVEPSDRIEAKIREEIDKLERYFDRITRCRVVVDMPHRHSEQGNRYHVGIRLTVPTTELVVSRAPGDGRGHHDLEVAVTDAFQAMRSQLEEYVGRLRRDREKTREGVRAGTILRLMPDDRYGFIRTPDGRDVYFHEHTLVSADFDELEVQTPVRFIEEEGDKGPQAREVYVLNTEPLPELEEG